MPYVITTRKPHDSAPFDARARITFEPSRRAVATLEEAREAVHQQIPAPTCADYHHEVYSLPEAGGTIGPLPDGTVIEVEPVEWGQLARLADVPFGDWSQTTPERKYAEVIDAYNAQ